jgi:hypothetical protein
MSCSFYQVYGKKSRGFFLLNQLIGFSRFLWLRNFSLLKLYASLFAFREPYRIVNIEIKT